MPDRLEKLVLMSTGRELGDGSVSVWSNGNFMVGGWEEMARVMDEMGARDKMVEVRRMRKEWGQHKYRGPRNRHGHSDGFPSYWAMGYKDLEEMREKVSKEEFEEYLRQHCRERGCCMPNETERKGMGLASTTTTTTKTKK